MTGKVLDASLSWEGSRFPYAHVCHGTKTLFDAGAVEPMEFPSFFKGIEAALPDGPDQGPVTDNHATDRTVKVGKWLACRRRRYIHFMPTSVSWLNRIELRFTELTGMRLQRGVHHPVAELKTDNRFFIDAQNALPKPCGWVKFTDGIFASVRRFRLKVSEPGAIVHV